jgi:shikimate dehydrogenase
MTEPRTLSASTVVAGVIGDPVAHSLSPAIHNAAYAALGLDWVYVGLPVPAGRGHDAIRALPAVGIAGVNVTMPHKSAAAEACDVLTGDAAALGAVNTVVVRPDGSLLGDSTDGAGFVGAVTRFGVDPAASRILVLGAGGAARAIVLALGRAGTRVMVAARRLEAARSAADLATGAEAHDWSDLATLVARCDVIVNATPIGMGGELPPFDPALIGPRHVVVDTVYHPAETPLLAAARARGARATNGIGMLVGQAALGFTLLTGLDAPFAVMEAAVEAELD